MGSNSAIEWTDATWTPIRARVKQDAAEIAHAKGYTSLINIASKMAGHVGPHCEHASPGCDNCYSENGNGRCLPKNGTGLPFDRRSRDLVEIHVDEKILTQPRHWWKARRIFVCSQTDLFGEFVTDEMIDRVFAVMALCPQHTFQVLTKQAKRMREYFADLNYRQEVIGIFAELWSGTDRFISGAEVERITGCGDDILPRWTLPLPHVHLGVSVEDQQRADERIPELLATPAAVRWLSVEPLLGPVDLATLPSASGIGRHMDSLSNAGVDPGAEIPSRIDWVVVGGESGPDARPMHPDWARSLRDQCVDAGVPFFFKQWGAFHEAKETGRGTATTKDGEELPTITYSLPSYCGSQWGRLEHVGRCGALDPDKAAMVRVPKSKAGRLLDCREWNELPSASGVHSSMEASPSLDCSTKKDLA